MGTGTMGRSDTLRKSYSREGRKENLLAALLRLRCSTRSPDKEYWPACPICKSRDWMQIEGWSRWPVCSRPNCTYKRALKRVDDMAKELVVMDLSKAAS
jgi:hypothetical protein